jgi:hypothetical protein
MKHLRYSVAALFALATLALTAGPAPAVQTAWGHHGGSEIAGQYSGSVTDSVLGTGTAVANLASAGSSVGGWYGFTFASTTYSNPTAAEGGWRGIEGTFVATIASSSCIFAYRASYDSSSFELNGKYKAISGCSGQNGSFSLTEQCYYSERGDIRRDGGHLMGC